MSTKWVGLLESPVVRLCISASVGSAEITIWYTYDDKIQATLPDKIEAAQISNLIIEAKDRLVAYKERQTVLGESEQEVFRKNDLVDDQLAFSTVFESFAIILLTIIETLVLRRFISKTEMF